MTIKELLWSIRAVWYRWRRRKAKTTEEFVYGDTRHLPRVTLHCHDCDKTLTLADHGELMNKLIALADHNWTTNDKFFLCTDCWRRLDASEGKVWSTLE